MPEPLLHEPAAVFLTIIAVILIAPLLAERVRLSSVIGLIIGGMIIGRYGLNLLVTGPVITLFGEVGLIYLMFNAGLEIDLQQLGRQIKRPVVFAGISYILPQASGILLGRLFGLSWAGAILLGAVYASQTLLAYPILSRLGIIRNEAVAITMGATVFTDIVSLLILAVITGSQDGGVSFLHIGSLVGQSIIYAAAIIVGVPRLGRLFFRHFSGNVVEFQFVLVVLFVSSVAASLIGIHTIVGAFLAGLAINETLSDQSRAMKNVLFMGNSFFVPLFLVTVGMRLDPLAVVANPRTLLIGISLTAAVYLTKFLASWITTRLYGYSRDEMLTMWGLSQAQAAATLATILVGTQAGIFPETIFNAAILMILFTSISSPILVQRYGERLKPPKEEDVKRPVFSRILVPVMESEPPALQLNLASILTRSQEGKMLVLNLAQKDEELKAHREKLNADFLKQPVADVELLDRIEETFHQGILKEALESQSSMIILDWPENEPDQEQIFEQLINEVIWNAKIPVVAARLLHSIEAIERLVFVVAAHTIGVKLDERSVELVEYIGDALEIPVIVMASQHYLEDLRDHFLSDHEESRNEIRALASDYTEQVKDVAGEHDLIMIPTMGSQRRFSDEEESLPASLLREINSSMIVIHVP